MTTHPAPGLREQEHTEALLVDLSAYGDLDLRTTVALLLACAPTEAEARVWAVGLPRVEQAAVLAALVQDDPR